MKRFLNFILIFLIFLIGAYLAPVLEDRQAIKEHPSLGSPVTPPVPQEKKEKTPSDKWAAMIGGGIEPLIQEFGEAKETVTYHDGSQDLVFGETVDDYMSVHINRKQTIDRLFIFGQQLASPLIKIGMSLSDLGEQLLLLDQVTVKTSHKSYQVDLTGNDLNTKPLIPFDNNSYGIVHLDQDTGYAMGISYLSGDALLEVKPYQQLVDEALSTSGKDREQPDNEQFKQRQLGELLRLVFQRQGLIVKAFDPLFMAKAQEQIVTLQKEPATIFKTENRLNEWRQVQLAQGQQVYFTLTSDELDQLFAATAKELKITGGLAVAPVTDLNLFVMGIYSGEFGQHPLDINLEKIGYQVAQGIALLIYQEEK